MLSAKAKKILPPSVAGMTKKAQFGPELNDVFVEISRCEDLDIERGEFSHN